MLRTEDLVQIDLKSLLAPGALVAVWCTNSQSHVDAIHESLFPAWGLRHVATWFWLKVDRSGTPVSHRCEIANKFNSSSPTKEIEQNSLLEAKKKKLEGTLN